MKRMMGTLLLASMLIGSFPARADVVTVAGRIRTAAVTPTVPRSLHLVTDDANGLLGWVTPLPASASVRPYEVTALAAASGASDIDVWFYRDLQGETGTGDPCPRDARDRADGGEEGTACAGARYAVVVLFAGSDVRFRLVVG